MIKIFIFFTIITFIVIFFYYNTNKTSLELSALTTSSVALTADNYFNNAVELESNPAVFDESGDATYGHFSVYRSAWKDNTGYFARNDGVGPFFRIKNFYYLY